MKKMFIVSLACILLFLIGCNQFKMTYQESFQVSVQNPLAGERKDVVVELFIKRIKVTVPEFNPNAFVVLSGGQADGRPV